MVMKSKNMFVGGVQRLLPSCDGPEGLFSSDAAPDEPSSRVFTVRPYRREDEVCSGLWDA